MNSQETPSTNPREDIYYGALLDAWQNTRMEHDKAILWLSSGAIGLLLTLLTTAKSPSAADVVLFLTATLFYVISIICVVFVFRWNADHLVLVAKGQEEFNSSLAVLDKMVSASFVLGMVISLVLGFVRGVEMLFCGG